MQIRKLLALQEVIEGRATPCDLIECDLEYYSLSKQMHIPIMDMHLTHLIRVFINLYTDKKEINEEKIIRIKEDLIKEFDRQMAKSNWNE